MTRLHLSNTMIRIATALFILLAVSTPTASFQISTHPRIKTRTHFIPISPLHHGNAPSVIRRCPQLYSTTPTGDNTPPSKIPNFPPSFTPSFQKSTLNAILLFLSFGYAIYTIFDIDHGMTRGWTQAEILTRLPFDNWRGYEESLSESPIFTKTAINVIIYLLGDWLSQTLFQKKDILDFDAGRTLKNGFIGLCFGPAVHEYYEFSDYILPVEVGVNRVYKIMMDQTIYLSVKISIYIMAVGVLNGSTLEESADNVKEKLKPIMMTAWKFWPLVHCVTYGLIPARHRILWVNCVDLIWNAILALKASAKSDDMEQESDEGMRTAEGSSGLSEVNVLHETDVSVIKNVAPPTVVIDEDTPEGYKIQDFDDIDVLQDAIINEAFLEGDGIFSVQSRDEEKSVLEPAFVTVGYNSTHDAAASEASVEP